jgi:hypothetical protein
MIGATRHRQAVPAGLSMPLAATDLDPHTPGIASSHADWCDEALQPRHIGSVRTARSRRSDVEAGGMHRRDGQACGTDAADLFDRRGVGT